MIGFIYDEYQNKSDLAEANYKWCSKTPRNASWPTTLNS